jgi:hypothetical protein
MPKYFIKIGYRKKPANQLEEQVQKAIFELDKTLWPTLDQAKYMVFQKFDDAVMGYRGRCKMNRPYGNEYTAGEYSIYADVCNVSIYNVVRDFTLGAQGYVFTGDATPEQLIKIDEILKPVRPEMPEDRLQKHY